MIQLPDNGQAFVELNVGVLYLKWAPGSVISENDARAIMATAARLSFGRPLPLLIDLAGIEWIDHGARNVFAACGLPRVAMLGTSPVDEITARFFLIRHSLPGNIRYFTCFDEARMWLTDAGNRADSAESPASGAAPE